MARHIKIITDKEKIVNAINKYYRITYHHSFNLGRQLEREDNHQKLIVGSYIKINGFKVHDPFFQSILDENNIKLARHCNANYRKEFEIRFIKSRFGESYVTFTLGGGRVFSSDSEEAKEFYGAESKKSVEAISKAISSSGIKEATRIKKSLQNEGLY